jgi:hypothetical protein
VKQKGFARILIVIILAIIGIAAAYYFGTQKGNVLPTPTQTPTSVATNSPTQIAPTVKPTVDLTANWKTYTNQSENYVVKYPPALSRLICPGEETQLFLVTNGNGVDPVQAPTCARGGRYPIEIATSNKEGTALVSNSDYKVDKESVTIAGIQAIEYTSNRILPATSPGEEWFIDVIFSNNGKSYDFYTRDKSLQTTFDQMLSTFKFTQ